MTAHWIRMKNQPTTAMARHKRFKSDPGDTPKLEVSSLIDVCFLLLIYFLTTSTLVPRESDLHMQLPRPGGAPPSPSIIRPLLIGVQSDGAVYTGIGSSLLMMDGPNIGRSLPLLSNHLDLYARATRAANEEPLVQLFVDGDASQQRVVDVLNVLASAKIKNVTFTDRHEM